MMDDTKKMLRIIINGQSAMKSELLTRIDSVDKKLTGRIDDLQSNMDKGFKKLTKRVDRIGFQVVNLEDDTPTREEHDNLEKRVTKLEHGVASV